MSEGKASEGKASEGKTGDAKAGDAKKAGWRAPTRRAFVGMLAAGAAALAARSPVPRSLGLASAGPGDDEVDRPRSTWTGTTRWIGHC